MSDTDFWVCVRGGPAPQRGEPARAQDAVPASLVHQLVVRFRIPEDEVAQMSKQEAIDRLAVLWSQHND